MSDKKIKRWNQVTETTNDGQRSSGVRAFKIESLLTSWEISGLKLKNKSIFFHLLGYSNYSFTLSNGEISCKKLKTKRINDSGVISGVDGRFNLVSDKGIRKTIRMGSLIHFLPEAFV